MRALGEVLRGFFKEDPRKKECAELAPQLREKMEGLLGDSDQISFSLTIEQANKLKLNDHWGCPANIGIKRKSHDLRFESSKEVLVLKGDNKLLIFDMGYEGTLCQAYAREGLVGRLVFGFDRLDEEIFLLKKWIGIATHLEELQKNPQTACSAPSASVS